MNLRELYLLYYIHVGLPIQDETVKTTQNSKNMTI